MVMHCKRYATAKMANYQVLFFVFHTMFLAIALGYLTLVERMPYCLMWYFWHSRDTGNVFKFINHTWIDRKSTTTRYFLGDAESY